MESYVTESWINAHVEVTDAKLRPDTLDDLEFSAYPKFLHTAIPLYK